MPLYRCEYGHLVVWDEDPTGRVCPACPQSPFLRIVARWTRVDALQLSSLSASAALGNGPPRRVHDGTGTVRPEGLRGLTPAGPAPWLQQFRAQPPPSHPPVVQSRPVPSATSKKRKTSGSGGSSPQLKRALVLRTEDPPPPSGAAVGVRPPLARSSRATAILNDEEDESPAPPPQVMAPPQLHVLPMDVAPIDFGPSPAPPVPAPPPLLPRIHKQPNQYRLFSCNRCHRNWACTRWPPKVPKTCPFCNFATEADILDVREGDIVLGPIDTWKSHWCARCQATTLHPATYPWQRRCFYCGAGATPRIPFLSSKPHRLWSARMLGNPPEGSLFQQFNDWPHGYWMRTDTGQVCAVAYLDVKGPGDALRFLHAITQWSTCHGGAPTYVFIGQKLRKQVEGLRYLVATGNRTVLEQEDPGVQVRTEASPIPGVGPLYWVDIHARDATGQFDVSRDLAAMVEFLNHLGIQWVPPQGTQKSCLVFEGYNGYTRYHPFPGFKLVRIDLNADFMEFGDFQYITRVASRPAAPRHASIVFFLRWVENGGTPEHTRNLHRIHLEAVYEVALELGFQVILAGQSKAADYRNVVEKCLASGASEELKRFYRGLLDAESFIAYGDEGLTYAAQYERLRVLGVAAGMVTSGLDLAAAAGLPILRDGDSWKQGEYTGHDYNEFLLCSETRGVALYIGPNDWNDATLLRTRKECFKRYLVELCVSSQSNGPHPSKVTYLKLEPRRFGSSETVQRNVAERQRAGCPGCGSEVLPKKGALCPGCVSAMLGSEAEEPEHTPCKACGVRPARPGFKYCPKCA